VLGELECFGCVTVFPGSGAQTALLQITDTCRGPGASRRSHPRFFSARKRDSTRKAGLKAVPAPIFGLILDFSGPHLDIGRTYVLPRNAGFYWGWWACPDILDFFASRCETSVVSPWKLADLSQPHIFRL
jgi:hypothetical protein